MNKYWKRNDEGSLAKLMLDIGKYIGRKDYKKLLVTVNKVKTKYNSLNRHTDVKSDVHWKIVCTRKLSSSQIWDIQDHYISDDISFPLPDKKYANKRFMRTSISRCSKMYNLLPLTTHKISTSTYYGYKPKVVKLQGHIPFHQS